MVVLYERPAPNLTTPTDDKYDWYEVQRRLRSVSLFSWVRVVLIFKPWLVVCAPLGTECAVTNMRKEPLYLYKESGENTYCLRMYPSPGFPGS